MTDLVSKHSGLVDPIWRKPYQESRQHVSVATGLEIYPSGSNAPFQDEFVVDIVEHIIKEEFLQNDGCWRDNGDQEK